MLFIFRFVFMIVFFLMINRIVDMSFTDGQYIETIWTALPGFILINLALPRLGLVYLIDEVPSPNLTIKAVGHQWYWEYEYRDIWSLKEARILQFDAYIVEEGRLDIARFRQLEVDNRLVIPYELRVRILVTSADVIHSWSLPNIRIKSDAVPGRLNQANIIRLYPSVIYGQCSEICGVGHSHMPIVVESVNNTSFVNWYMANLE